MFERNKWLLSIIVGGMVLSGIAIIDRVVIEVIFSVSGVIAYSFVGSLISTGFITSRADAGEARMGFFVVLIIIFTATYLMIIKFIIWLISFPLWIYIMVFILLIGLLILYLIINKRAELNYVEQSENEKSKIDDYTKDAEESEPKQLNNIQSDNGLEELKTIYQLLDENKDKSVIYVEKVTNESPGLEYIQVNQKALNYPKLKGYLKMDNAGKFREIYYADKKIWRLHWMTGVRR